MKTKIRSLTESACILLMLSLTLFSLLSYAKNYPDDTFKRVNESTVPQTAKSLWQNYDPRKEPLNVKVLKQWEEEGVVIKVVRYQVGTFKGQAAHVAAVYGYPKNVTQVPGLVNVHGGGQYADYRAILANGENGYATISISWAGRVNAADYKVNPQGVKLFWDQQTDHPDYKLTTDWGPLDGYHAPHRNKNNSPASVAAHSWTLDDVDSPRNSMWFLATLAARRAITFLEQQPQVDANKLGIYGHSMGGKITVLTASDPRIKAAAPSCGGISDINNANELYENTLGDAASLREITAPIIFLSPSNDFHGKLKDLPEATNLIQSHDWRVVSSAHSGHQDLGEYEVPAMLWFDQHLKETFELPKRPQTAINLDTKDGIPTFTVIADGSRPILAVDVYYTQQASVTDPKSNPKLDRENRKRRFWHHAKTQQKGGVWQAKLPVFAADKEIWAYADVTYDIGKTVTGAGYYYNIYDVDKFALASVIHKLSVDEVKAANINATLTPSLIIEDFSEGWQKEWFKYKLRGENGWQLQTHKLYSPLWKAPKKAQLAFTVRAQKANTFVAVLDEYAVEIKLIGNHQSQDVFLSPSDFKDALGKPLTNWENIKHFALQPSKALTKNLKNEKKRTVFGIQKWLGTKPQFTNLRWLI